MARPPMARVTVLLIVLSGCAALLLAQRLLQALLSADSAPVGTSKTEQTLKKLWDLAAHEKNIDQTAWAKERLAERYGAVFDRLWDSLNRATNKLESLASFPLGSISFGNFDAPRLLPHGIELWEQSGSATNCSAEEWKSLLS